MSIPQRVAVRSDDAPKPAPFLSSGLVVNGVVYCSGQVGSDPKTGKLVEGGVGDRTKQILNNLDAVLKAGGSSLQDAIKINIFLTDMKDYAAMNEVYDTFFGDVKPVRTCVAVKQLPLGTDIEIEASGLITKSKL